MTAPAMQLKDVPSGVEVVPVGNFHLPEYAKSSVPCHKMSWIFDEQPRIELEFGSDHKKFILLVESSTYDFFKNTKECTFERTATDTIFTMKRIDRNPPSRLSVLEEYSKKYLQLLVVEKFEVHFKQFQKFDFMDLFIWKITKKFWGIYFNPSHDVVFTPAEVKFVLGELQAEIFTLPKIRLPSALKKGDMTAKPIKHTRLNFDCEFLPFDYFIKMESKRVITRTNTMKSADLHGFIKSWIRGKRLRNLKSFIVNFTDLSEELTYEAVLRDIISIPDIKEKIVELSISDLQTKDIPEDKGREIKRRDGAIANIFIDKDTFSLVVKE